MQAPSEQYRRTAFITGASFGIGAATALALARDGFDLAVSATRLENLSTTLETLKNVGVRAYPVALDLRSLANLEQAIASVIDALGWIDVLVNNAAGISFRKPALEITRDEWEPVVVTVVTGTFLMSQQMARHLIASKRSGCIINMASTHGMVGFPGRSAYGIAKAAVIHMTRMLAIEWADHNIRVNAVAPGSTATAANAAYMADPKNLAMLENRIPLRRVATADEIAAAVSYLASPQASYITGQTLVLDGGLTSH